jgi:hypothetical protein
MIPAEIEQQINAVKDSKQEVAYPVFMNFLTSLLTYYPTEKAFEISSNYLCQFKMPYSIHIEYWLKQFKKYDGALTADTIENLWRIAEQSDHNNGIKAAKEIAKRMGETAISRAVKMLSEQLLDGKLVGEYILSYINSQNANNILRAHIENETQKEVLETAKVLKKLTKPVLDWLANYPPLNYKNGTDTLDSATINFLFYRIVSSNHSDQLIRPILLLIDRKTSAPFAKWLLDYYFQNGANSKLKGFLTLGVMLGGDNEIAFLQRNIVSFVDNKRTAMAKFLIEILALQGSQKALRTVDFLSRKYKTKNKSIGETANRVFNTIAEELNMTPYELADSVIPDFGFDGLFKEFDANNETYRAYIGNDFKLAFLDEDNKNLKALPKGTSAAVKDEFKEIGKEIRDIVKSQSSRLEQYLVIQRRWSVDKWEGLFLTNPTLFIYAVRLIWGIFDDKNTLISVFRCQEDQSLTDAEGNEIDFDALKSSADVRETFKVSLTFSPENTVYTEGSLKLSIGMVHPIDLTAETIDFWKNDLLDNGIEPIFPQLNRRVFLSEKTNINLCICDEFEGVQVGGYTFLSRLDKNGWLKGSIGEGAAILSYYKTFMDVELLAIVTQTGDLSIGNYDVNAAIGKIMFVKKNGIGFNNYQYNEPRKMNDPRLVRFGDVPPIVYSEVMADMAFFKENQVK